MKLAAWRESRPLPAGSCIFKEKLMLSEYGWGWEWGGEELGGVENSWALLALFQDISFIDASLRPEYSECGPCIRVGLHLLRTEVEGKYSETFPARAINSLPWDMVPENLLEPSHLSYSLFSCFGSFSETVAHIVIFNSSSGNSIRKHCIKQYFSSATCPVSTFCCDNNKNSQTLDNTNQQSELKFLLVKSWLPWETWVHWWYVNLRPWRNCEMTKGSQWLKVSIYIAWSESSECMSNKVTSETG